MSKVHMNKIERSQKRSSFYCSPVASILLIVSIALFPLSSFAESKTTPLNLIKGTIDKVIETNKKLEGDEKLEQRRKELRTIIEPYFDFDEMAKRSLGSHWTTINETQQKEFVEVFSELLARTYLSRIDNVTTQVVTFDSEKITPPRAIVKTTINFKGDSFPIEYRFLDQENNWKVYDVIIENIGLVANYRNEFAGLIRREKFDGLMTKLKKRLESVESTA